ncbi:Clp protease ClpP [Roseibium sp. Sym1]|uniref:Clp protease ClpP n=1 Tax=Roseibium sp. Sym1 TaxID=3016006 RepID=UPI0022B51859|nr:Clp protease ClpP [Roseibium sp. Sym1]
MTLYMKLGGRKMILQAMPHLLSRLEQDPCFNLGNFRQELERSDDLTEFLVFLSGGAPIYEGKPICDLLSPICTDREVYARFVDHLVAVLLGGSAATGDEADLRMLMDRLRPHVLAPRPVAPVKVFAVEPEMQGA